MTEALYAFSERGLTSVALPPVGTGNLKFPLKEVADTLVNTTVKFLNANPGSTLKEIRYVSYFQPDVTMVSFIYNLQFGCDR